MLMGMGSGRAWSVYTSAAMAPACCALFSFCSKVQTPRRIRAMDPRRLLAGSAAHAMPLPSSAGDVHHGRGGQPGPTPNCRRESRHRSRRSDRLAVAANTRSLSDAPTAIAEGAVAGDATVAGSGPLLPDATTTITPSAEACSMAVTSGSFAGSGATSVPRLMLITSMPSATASSSAFRMALSVAPSFTPGDAENLVAAQPRLGRDAGDGGQRSGIGHARGGHRGGGAVPHMVARRWIGIVRGQQRGIAARHDDLVAGVGHIGSRR